MSAKPSTSHRLAHASAADTRTRRVLPAVLFFKLVDEVLQKNKRAALDSAGPQRRIIEVRDHDRVLQILAGPGAGKTEMLVWRALYELLVRGTPSNRVLVTTFTRRAATEITVRLVERCDQLLAAASAQGHAADDPHVHDVRIGTIHSLCDALLAEFDDGYMASGTNLIDEIETRFRLGKDRRLAFRIPPSNPNAVDTRLPQYDELTCLFRAPWDQSGQNWPSTNMEHVDYFSALLMQQTETWLPRCAATNKPNGVERVHKRAHLTADLVKFRDRWEAYLDRNHVLDFTTIQKRFLDRQDKILPHIDHIFVDEFQDTNPIQFAIHTRWLQRPTARLTVVGDDDQSLYRFRGSDIGCFQDLEPHCKQRRVPHRLEKMEENWRSTRAIVDFARAFRDGSALRQASMPKTIVAPKATPRGVSVRLLTGKWADLCAATACELESLGAGKVPTPGKPLPPDAAVLMFSTSERGKRTDSAAKTMRDALETRKIRIFNPRNKTVAEDGPVAELLGLVSYLVDPTSKAPVGKRGGRVMVCASDKDAAHKAAALTMSPTFPISQAHVPFQRRLLRIADADPDYQQLLTYINELRDELVAAMSGGNVPKLTLAGFIARLLSFPVYRAKGYSIDLFRQAMFTQILESSVASTRLSSQPLDQPLQPTRDPRTKKYVWPDAMWSFLNAFGALLDSTQLDDVEVEAFSDNAVLLMTFHQAKGLEYDHVYVAATGRQPSPHAVLQTKLFSGEPVHYTFANGLVTTLDEEVLLLAEADRDREVYVALTRAKKQLSILFDPTDDRPNMALHGVLARLFDGTAKKPHPRVKGVTVQEYNA